MKADKKQQTIQAAIELFATQGYENTSIAQICQHAHVSKGLVFHHFKNKEDLLRAVFLRMAEIITEVGERAAPLSDDASAKARFIQLVDQIFLSMADEEQKLFYQLDYQVKCQPTTRLMLKDLLDARYDLMLASFNTILCDVPAANCEIDTPLLIAEIDGIALNYLFADESASDAYPLEAMKERFINKYLLLLNL